MIVLNILKNFINNNKELIIFLFIVVPIFFVLIKTSFLFIIISSIIVSYFLYKLEKMFLIFKIPSDKTYLFSYFSLVFFCLGLLYIIIPMILKYIINFSYDFPYGIQKIKIIFFKLVLKYPLFFPKEYINNLFINFISKFQLFTLFMINFSFLSVIIIIKWSIYFLFIPIFTFFFLKDRNRFKFLFETVMNEKIKLLENIWMNSRKQINNYINCKIFEFLLIIIMNYVLFKWFDLLYASFWACITGFSVIIPYIGVIISSVPIFCIILIQFGLSHDFYYLLFFYIIIQIIDGIIIVPILFSNIVKLHPLTIIISIITLGYFFKIYGLFFAIPIAIVIKSIIKLYFFNNIK